MIFNEILLQIIPPGAGREGRKNKFFKELLFKNKNPDLEVGGTPHALERTEFI
jgi:hypothetical protein